jgi:hypothetical protein
MPRTALGRHRLRWPAAYRRELGCDDDECRRGRGWALTTSPGALPYNWHTSPTIREHAQRTVAAVLEESANDTGVSSGGGLQPRLDQR